MPAFAVPQATVDLWNYRVGLSVRKSFVETRRKLRRKVLDADGDYSQLWRDEWWSESVSNNIQPTLRQMYEEVAEASAVALGLGWMLRSDRINDLVNIRLGERLELVQDVNAHIQRQVALTEAEALGESSGWVLNRLGLFDGSDRPGPLSPGMQKVITTTETNSGINAAVTTPLDLLSDEDIFDEVDDADALSFVGATAYKQWSCQMIRSRDTHIDADGQQVGPGEFFDIGGYPCEFPGDPSLPPEESINCLCSVMVEVG